MTRLATFTAGYDVFGISLVRGYKEQDFREDLRNLYKCVLDKPRTFLFTDSHVAEEGFLELINNILTIGMVPALFPEEEKDGLINPLDDEMRKQKLPETKEFRWSYYVNKCRESLHIVLAMSPAGDTLRLRCRNFPGLISNTNVDWFFPWPEDALTAVASNFMGEVKITDEERDKVTSHLVMVHMSVQQYSEDFKAIYKRANYSTPKNYLDFIKNYTLFLKDKRNLYDNNVRRLEGGLTTLAKAQKDTEILSKELEIQNAEIAKMSINVKALIDDISQKSEVAAVQAKSAGEKKEYLDKQSIIIAREEAEAAVALEAAIPALEQAKAALANITKDSLNEIKALASPPAAIQDICTVCFFLYPKTVGNNPDWTAVKNGVLNDTKMIDNLKGYAVDKLKTDGANKGKKKMERLIKDLGVTDPDDIAKAMTSKSLAAGALYKWCAATLNCYDIFKEVEPKRKKAEEMKKQKEKGERELAETEANLAELKKSLAELNADMKIKQDELDILTERSATMTRKLNAAS